MKYTKEEFIKKYSTQTRTDVLNHLVARYQLSRYLEIGVQDTRQNFDKINCPYKVGVDPDPKANASFCMTSDEFFENGFDMLYVNHSWETKFDIVLIDGLHTAEQVRKDFENALKILSPNGFIVLHDCNPEKEEHTIVPRPTKTGHWNGDVYKTACYIITRCGLDDSGCYAYTVNVDNGCLVFQKTFKSYTDVFEYTDGDFREWQEFDANRKELLNLISWDEFIEL